MGGPICGGGGAITDIYSIQQVEILYWIYIHRYLKSLATPHMRMYLFGGFLYSRLIKYEEPKS